MFYIALGDSITFGQGASAAGNRYCSRILTHLESRSASPVQGLIIAKPGWTSSALAGTLGQGLGAIRRCDTVTVWIGGNDLGFAALGRGVSEETVKHTLLRYGQNLARICGAIRQVSDARIVLCTQYNPFPKSPVAAKAVKGLNAVTKQTAKQFRCDVAPVHKWFAGRESELIDGYKTGRLEDAVRGPRPVHPNDRGHAVIASGLLPYVRKK